MFCTDDRVVESVVKKDKVIKTEPQIVHRTISEETSGIISSMLVSRCPEWLWPPG
jgi:membrane peptidoglycan carboxypeptidase